MCVTGISLLGYVRVTVVLGASLSLREKCWVQIYYRIVLHTSEKCGLKGDTSFPYNNNNNNNNNNNKASIAPKDRHFRGAGVSQSTVCMSLVYI